MSVTPTKKPTGAVKAVGMKRDGNKIVGSWTVPPALVKDDSKKRATKLKITGTLSTSKGNRRHKKESGTSKTSYTVNVNNFVVGSKTFERESFYPMTNRLLNSVSIAVVAGNSVGWSSKKATGTFSYKKPRKPSIAAIAVDESSGVLSTTITTNAGTDKYERYDTQASYTVVDTLAGTTTTTDITHDETSYAVSYNVSNYQELSYDDYVKLTVRARARGLAGASKWADEAVYYMSYPAQATIKEINVSGKDSTGKVTIRIDTNATEQHPVDKVELETLANVTYATVSEIPADATWQASGIVDDGECTALAVATGNVNPTAGNYTWIRVKSTHAIEDVLYRYSEYRRIEALELPAATAADDDIAILDASSGDDGKSAVVQLGWNIDGNDDSTGTELSWSEDMNVWKSTEDPDTYEFEWTDGEYTSGTTTYLDSANITIKGLDEGVPYYIRARRYLDADTRTYSDYSNTWSVIPSAAPDGVVAMCDRYVARGNPLLVEWTFGGGGTQTSWAILDESGTTIFGNTGTDGSYSISADRLESLATNNQLTFAVQVSTGGDPAVSESVTVTIVDEPELTAFVDATVTAQPVELTFTSTTLCSVSCVITSDGASGQTPAGIETQEPGATVWSDVITPEWSGSAGAYTCTYDVPVTRSFWDGIGYTLTATATDLETGLKSDTVLAEFAIDWARKAPDPESWVSLKPRDYVDHYGVHRLVVELTLSADGAADTDVLDVYRLTGDGAALIGSDLPLTYTGTDEYAPFGTDIDMFYRVACRTVDGSQEYADIGYDLEFKSMRFDWANGYLELPYEISISDGYAKKSKIFEHQDGSNSAHYNPGVNRTSKLGSAIVRIDSQEDIAAARAMARYPGTVFVRTPDGSAYEADVQVSDLSGDGVLLSISLDNTEVNLSETYMLPVIAEDTEE